MSRGQLHLADIRWQLLLQAVEARVSMCAHAPTDNAPGGWQTTAKLLNIPEMTLIKAAATQAFLGSL